METMQNQTPDIPGETQACGDVHGPLWKLIRVISAHTASFCVEVKEKWQQQMGFTGIMFHP